MSTTEKNYSEVVKTAQTYYNSVDADTFYATIWGGEDIHIGIYTSADEPIYTASQRTVEQMAGALGSISPEARVIDVGAGYGGSARYLARTAGCRAVCLNLSETQNERNRRINRERGLDHLIDVVDGNFEEIPYEDSSFDIVWSQDAFLHSGNRQRVIAEVQRVLKKGGDFIFTDPMQSDDCPPGVLQPVLNRIHLDTLGSYAFYRQVARELGFEEVQIIDLSEQLVNHYSRVRAELTSRYDEIVATAERTLEVNASAANGDNTTATQARISREYVDNMLQGLGHWVEAGQKGYLSWGIIHFRLTSGK